MRKPVRQKAKSQPETRISVQWTELGRLITRYGEACRADEMKGGGDPADYDVVALELELVELKLHSHIMKMRRELENTSD